MAHLSRRQALGAITAGFVALSGCNDIDDDTEDPGVPEPDEETSNVDPDVYDIEFDRVVNAVDDLGMDPSGEDPIDDALAEAFETGTRIEFPPGDYTVAEEAATDPPHNPSRFGIVGLGDSHRDVQFHFPNAADEEGFWFVYQKGGEDVVLANFSIQLTDDKRTSVSILLDANDNGIAVDLEWLGFIPSQAESAGSLLRMNVDSENGATTEGVSIARRITMGRQGSYLGGHRSSTNDTPGTTFMRHQPTHVGELRLEDVHFEQCGHNAMRSTNNDGVVTVKGGYFLNCDVSSLRFQGGDHPTKTSVIDGAHVEQDHSKLNETGGTEPHQAAGIVIDTRKGNSGLIIRNCDLIYKDISVTPDNAGSLWGMIRCTNTVKSNPGGFTVRNCRIRNDTKAPTLWIQSSQPGAKEPRGVTLENLDVRVTAEEHTRNSVCEIHANRDGSRVSNCCIQALNGTLNGVTITNCLDVLVENSNIDVSGDAVQLVDSVGDALNINVERFCGDT
ncbi:hypothetical protein [Halorubrum sp. DTA46]|uniref:hypothetical protein n=1 Tax=Halorubrum sp. DTA46 TaxID=3402162 RepID=UPI003AB06646